MSSDLSPKQKHASVAIGLTFFVAALSVVGFTVVFWYNDNIQLEGIFIGITFMLLAVGLVMWSQHLLPEGPFAEEFPELQSGVMEEAKVLASLDRGQVGRRKVLIGSLGLAGAAITSSVASTMRSLGPGPYSLRHTAWRGGKTVATLDNVPVRVSDVPVDSIIVVYPLGFTNSPEVQATLIHLPPGLNRPLPRRSTWAPHGFICYSRVCSHAGCPVALYNHVDYELQCPCHQSTFNVLDGAEPVFGPAGGPLVQLPLAINPDGTLRSTGDFSGPPGPVYWHYHRS